MGISADCFAASLETRSALGYARIVIATEVSVASTLGSVNRSLRTSLRQANSLDRLFMPAFATSRSDYDYFRQALNDRFKCILLRRGIVECSSGDFLDLGSLAVDDGRSLKRTAANRKINPIYLPWLARISE